MAHKLLNTVVDPNVFGTTLTVTGDGGFGKTTLVKALCYHEVVQQIFTDGFVFIELGPQTNDPGRILCQLYHLLTDKNLKQGDVNIVAKKIKQITKQYFCNLLVIIDDVWQIEDAEPIVTAFSNCKTVLTTRMNNITRYIPTKEMIVAGPMEHDEAVSLLTSGIADKWTQDEMGLLSTLAQDVHLWPLLLSLVRGQLSHNLREYKLGKQAAIENIHARLKSKGLTAFDRNNIEKSTRNRKYAVKACIDLTLELLSKSTSDKIKSLIIYNGIGTSLSTSVLHNLWKVYEQDASDMTDLFWSYGLVSFIDVMIPPQNNTQTSVEVHAVISQYILENLESEEVIALSPFGRLGTFQSVGQGLMVSFRKSYGLTTITSSVVNYLNYTLNEIEYVKLPDCFRTINGNTIFDPHDIILLLKQIQEILNICGFSRLPSLKEQFTTLENNCTDVIKKSQITSRLFNQKVQKYMYEKNFDSLLHTVQEYCKNYPIGLIALNCIKLVKSIIPDIPRCEDEAIYRIMIKCEMLEIKTPNYNIITLLQLPRIKLYIEQFRRIESALRAGSPDTETVYHSITTSDMFQPIYMNYLNKIREVAPNFAHQLQ